MNAYGGTLSIIKGDGTYQYFYDDTILKMLKINSKDHSHDSVLYYYNDQNLLIEKAGAPAKIDSYFSEEDDRWHMVHYCGDTTNYFYDGAGKKTEQRYRDQQEYFFYDEQGRLQIDSTWVSYDHPNYIVSKYVYLHKQYRYYSLFSNCNCIRLVDESKLDDNNKVTEETTYTLKEGSENNLILENLPDSLYSIFEKTNYSYYPSGDVQTIKFYVENTLTTTHLFVYE